MRALSFFVGMSPFPNAWEVYEAPGVHPVSLNKEQAIDYATCRACSLLAYRELGNGVTPGIRSKPCQAKEEWEIGEQSLNFANTHRNDSALR